MSVERNPLIHYVRVEKAKEYESYRRLPKFTHVPMAVINPATMKKRTPPRVHSPSLMLSASQARVQ
jgi:hypothetical protein